MIVLSILAYAAGLALMAFAESAFMLGAAALVAGLAHGAIFPILTSQVVLRSRTAERGSAISIFTSLFEVSVLLAAPAVGFLIDDFSYRVGFGSAALALVIGAIAYAFWDTRLAATERVTV